MDLSFILYQLTARLSEVNGQLEKGVKESNSDENNFRALYASAYVAALACERNWLMGFIRQISELNPNLVTEKG